MTHLPRYSLSPLAVLALATALSGGLAAQAAQPEIPPELFDADHLPSLAGRIEWIAREFHERGDFNGSLLVAREGETLYAGHFGYRDLARKIPNSAATRYRLGSIGKQYTATAILILMQDGKL